MSQTTSTARPAPTTAADVGAGTARRRAGTATAYRWEVTKLLAQLRTRAMLALCLIAPPAIVAVLRGQRPPVDTLYGRYVHDSGLAVPLLVLGFTTAWVLPLLTSIVAGDIFASEDAHGTWKTVLTRSASRTQIFWAKTLAAGTFAAATLVILATSTIVSALVLVGAQPLVGLSGQSIPASAALPLVIASWASVGPSLLAFTALAILLSVLTRNSAIGVAGPVVIALALTLLGAVSGTGWLRRVLITTPLESWHGLLAAHPFHAPLLQGLAISAAWTAVCLILAHSSLVRRDITGG